VNRHRAGTHSFYFGHGATCSCSHSNSNRIGSISRLSNDHYVMRARCHIGRYKLAARLLDQRPDSVRSIGLSMIPFMPALDSMRVESKILFHQRNTASVAELRQNERRARKCAN
jgi:hypothetical protein